ncbi:hypothetical protein FACS1894172_01870 [Spirochaetia bacterium]|nr:hypothetical protein FACS1894172_01870 [Spirochaetia bacterium]
MSGSDSRPNVVNANEHHVACLLLLDTSGSMDGVPITALNEAVNRFKFDLSGDDRTRKVMDIAVVEFNDTVNVIQDFCPIEQMQPVNLIADGHTHMGPAVELAVQMVRDRTHFLNKAGAQPHVPWIVLISDGAPYPSSYGIETIAQVVRQREEEKKLLFWCFGVQGYDRATLQKLAPERTIELAGYDFRSLFEWLYKSMAVVSQSVVGQSVTVVAPPAAFTIPS